MDYRQQELFLNRYARIGIALLVVASVSFAGLSVIVTPGLGTAARIGYAVLVLGLAYAVFYVPKYLILTIEETKKFSWSIRIRWILSVVLLLGGGLVFRTGNEWAALATAVVLLAGTNAMVRRQAVNAEYERRRFVPFVYFTGDLVVLAVLLWVAKIPVETGILLGALSLHLLVLLLPGRQLNFFPAFFASTAAVVWAAGGRGPHLGVMALFATASLALVWMSRAQHEENLVYTLASLMNFTGDPPEEVQHLLLTSTGMLAANWNAAPPKTNEELEAWYRENADYYLYDLSQFHLAYKHITFTLDVISQSRGRILDYGGGIGDLTLDLAGREGNDVTYLDVDGESQRYARWRARERGLPVRFVSDRDNLTGQFDTIILLDVLEHVADPEETLEFLNARLVPGGVLIASVAFGATKAHPMHFDHTLDVPAFLSARGYRDAKDWRLKLFGSEAMRRKGVIVFRKQ